MGDTIVAWAIHHQDDVTYGISSGFQCSCMSLVWVSWSPGLLDKFDLLKLHISLRNSIIGMFW